MVFSGLTFLFCFLPVTLVAYYIVPASKDSSRNKNIVLLIASIIFYAWGEPVYVLLMAAQCALAWASGLLIGKHRGRKKAKIITVLSVIVTLSGLIYFKYANFFITGASNLTGARFALVRFVMPVGISFYTFQILSYTLDLYNGRISMQRNIVTFAAYVTSFPQLVAGPIVRYADVEGDLKLRAHSRQQFARGAQRFILGLGKKVLIANVFAQLVEIYKISGDQSALFTWLYIIAFTLQIYFDFSGYSDMAIGLGHIFGFHFPENFNYPYTAGSITDFWKRWHITLSSWFRDYLYIPLGGNRAGTARNIMCLLFVWGVTGFWHGANWNFLLWGIYFGILLVAEKYLLKKAAKIVPRPLKHLLTLAAVVIGWVFFDAGSVGQAAERIRYMSGAGGGQLASEAAVYYLRSYAVPLIAGIIAATPVSRCYLKLTEGRVIANYLEPFFLCLVLLLSTAAIVDGSYNPFIYFRF